MGNGFSRPSQSAVRLGEWRGQKAVIQQTSNGRLVHVLADEHEHLLAITVVLVPIRLPIRPRFLGDVDRVLIDRSPTRGPRG